MECIATFLLFVMVVLAIVMSVAGRSSRRTKQRKTFAQLARQFNGLYHSGGIFKGPSVRLRYGETWGAISSSRAHGDCLQVRIHWPHKSCCELITRTAFGEALKDRRLWQPIDIQGDVARTFEVRGRDTEEVQQLLTSGVCWQIDRLATLGPLGLYVVIQSGTIVAEKPWSHLSGELPAQFVQGALELYDQCMLAKAVGIQFLHADEAQPLDHVICKVCGEEIRDQMVVCRRCKTPHHLDCWEYTGACSVFGCRETKHSIPAAGRVTPPH